MRNWRFIFALQLEIHPEIIQGLKDDRFDIGFCSMAEGENDILFTPVGREELVVVTPKGHPISYESAVDLKQVAEYPQIFYTSNSGLRPVVNRMFEQAKLKPKIAYEIEEDGSMAGLVAQNFWYRSDASDSGSQTIGC